MTVAVLARIRTIARGGDTMRAWRMFDDAGLAGSADPDVLCLKGRLLKDRALRGDASDRSALLVQAQQAYMQAARDRRATYPLINAATLAFLNDRRDEADDLARTVLDLLDSGDHEAETRYWLGATAAEALLLLDRADASRTALEQAVAAAPEAWEDHAATLRQLRQILAAKAMPDTLFDHVRPPPCLYFCGIIGLPEQEDEARQRIEEALDRIAPGAVYGALAAGADILVAELAIARRAQLHVILPTALDIFRQESVARFGSQWARRFDRLIDLADSLEAPDTVTALSEAAIVKGAEIAMGLAVRRADALATKAVALHVGRESGCGFAPQSQWERSGLPLHSIILGDTTRPAAEPLATAVNRAILASLFPFPVDRDYPSHPLHILPGDPHILIFDDLPTAMEAAERILEAMPQIGLGLEYRTLSAHEPIGEGEGLASILAQTAPAGSICAPWPQAAALNILAPQWRFEVAGEILTPYGDCPVAQHYPRTQS